MINRLFNRDRYLDFFGIFLSFACAIHCLAIPIIAILDISNFIFLESEWVHFALILCVVPIAAFSLLRGYKIHKKTFPLVLGIFGILWLVIALAIEGWVTPSTERALTIIGSGAIIAAHFFNLHLSLKSSDMSQS